MPILNIKNVPQKLYNRLRQQAENERRSISSEVIYLLESTLLSRSRKFSDFRGKGKEIWKGINALHYVDKQRHEWNS